MQKETENNDRSTQPRTLVDILIRHRQSNPHFTQTQLRDEMLNVIVTVSFPRFIDWLNLKHVGYIAQFLLQGSESTAVMSSFVLLMLAMNRDAQVCISQSIRTVSKRF